MSVDRIAEKGLDVQLPRAGLIGVYAITNVASVINMTTGTGVFGSASLAFPQALPDQGSQTLNLSGGAQAGTFVSPKGFVGQWVDIFADGTDVGIISGPTNASVSGGNVPALATTGTPGTAGACWRIPSGTFRSYYVKPDDLFLGVIGAASGNLRIAISSR